MDVRLTMIVLQVSGESSAVSLISSLTSTFFAAAFSFVGELRHTFAKCPAFPHDKHLLA